MRTTIGRMLGTLPETFFSTTVSANKTEHLAQLCSSTMMTGYLFRNVQQRLELQQQMGDFDGGHSLHSAIIPAMWIKAAVGEHLHPTHAPCAGRAALASDVLAVCRAEQQYAEGSKKDGVQV